MKGLSPEQQKQLILSVGSHLRSRPLTPVEVGLLLQDSLRSGSTPDELAEALHLDGPSMISRFVRLLSLSIEIQHLIDWGSSKSAIAFTAASELARLPENDHLPVVQAALENRLSSLEIKQVVQARLRSKRPIGNCIEEIVRMRPQIERSHLFIGAVTSGASREALAKLSQHERDELLARVLKEAYPDMKSFSARLGPARFAIAGTEEMAGTLNAGQHDFETVINRGLERTVATT